MSEKLATILHQTTFSDDDLRFLLSLSNPEDCLALQKRAYELTTQFAGNKVYLRGLIEISNVCVTNCRYCGIRKSNKNVARYTLTEEEILSCAKFAAAEGYGSIAIQAGERRDPKYIEFIANLLKKINEETRSEHLPTGLGITLSLGEQSLETYQYWAKAANNPTGLRYLLRFETSNETIFNHLHSTPGKFEKRLEHRYQAIENLKNAGYQTGSGVMIGIPTQTIDDLVKDLRKFDELNLDMVGMGPYLTSQGADMCSEGMLEKHRLMQLSLNMIAVLRLMRPKMNIAAATALETLQANGRIQGILYGCNVVMPNITPQSSRNSYQLYDNKAGTEVGKEANIEIEQNIVRLAHRELGLNLLGSSKQWSDRIAQQVE